MDKIKRVSKQFRILFQILFFMTPIIILFFWATIHTSFDLFSKLGIGFGLFTYPATLNFITRILGFTVTLLLPGTILMYTLTQLIKLFKNYERGDIFSIDNVNRYRKLGYSLFVWFIGGLIYDALISLVMTFQNTGFKKVIAVGISSMDIVVLITGGIILLIAWVIKEAYEISEEQRWTL